MPRGVPRALQERREAEARQQVESGTVKESVTMPAVLNAPQTIKPADLRNWSGDQLYVKNNGNETIVFDDMRGAELRLGHNGSGEEAGVLPLDVAKHPGFQKIWRRGKVSVSTDPAMEEELFLMEARADEMARRKAEGISSMIEESPASKDLVETNCAHCNTKIFITVQQAKAEVAPPLCLEHQGLAPLFSLEYYQDMKTGDQKSRWVSTVIGPVVKESAVSS